MKEFLKTEEPTKKLMTLVGFFVAISLLSNIVAGKIANLGFTYATVAILIYPLTFILADTIAEVWGKEIARRTVWTGLSVNFVISLLLTMAVYFPPAPFYEHQTEFELILGGVPRIVIASLIAYTISQNLDVWMFLTLRKKTKGKHLWLRNNASTMASQLIDTIIFSFVAFWGQMSVFHILQIIMTEYTIKILLSIFGTPLTYGLVAWARRGSGNHGKPQTLNPAWE
ncbi:MAG: queuosine precursor transporter [Thermicanus sp.]|nr:queuosine precursor transporter [Thermicanus sp.]